MVNSIQLFAIVLAGLTVAIADALIKKTALEGSFWLALKNPWMLAVLVLYVSQIILFLYVFSNHWELGIVGNTQMIIYAVTTVLIGFLFFGEKLSLLQIAGVVFGLIGVILMNL
jgi:drug/metabolite transporter (DMT)-like permease